MNRQVYFDEIESRMSWLATRIELRSSLNILNLNLHSEDFYIHFLNAVYDLELVNLNSVEQNTPGLDLVDITRKLVVQVSSTATKQKIEASLAKDLVKYAGYKFWFVSISKKVRELKRLRIQNPSGLHYDPEKDTLDLSQILSNIKSQSIEKVKVIRDLVCEELKFEPDRQKVESNLASIIEILAQVDWKLPSKFSTQTVPYDIDRKISFNNLSAAHVLIHDYKSYYFKVNQIYSSFDQQGANKSLSVLNGLRTLYLAHMDSSDADTVFNLIVKRATELVIESKNYTALPIEELQMCVEILTVDAFVRCKIFKNPVGYLSAAT
jgi:hypothetical protein